MDTKYKPPVVAPRPGIHPAQIAAEQARLRGEDPTKAYTAKLREMGEKPVIPD